MHTDSLTILPDLPPFSREVIQRLGLRGLHCACGRNLRAKWLNVDRLRLGLSDGRSSQYGRIAVFGENAFYLQTDLTQALPFDAETFEWIYAEHFIEHLAPEAAIAWLQEVRRVLRPDGVLRLSTPDLGKYVEGYLDPRGSFVSDRRQHLKSLNMGEIPERRAWIVNNVFYGWGHRWIYDFEELKYTARQAGFPEESVSECSFRQGRAAELFDLDLPMRRHESLYLEIKSPKG